MWNVVDCRCFIKFQKSLILLHSDIPTTFRPTDNFQPDPLISLHQKDNLPTDNFPHNRQLFHTLKHFTINDSFMVPHRGTESDQFCLFLQVGHARQFRHGEQTM